MEIRETQCDVKGCRNRNASSFSIFSHRAADAAGGMEEWHHVFDLCPSCAVALTHKLLERILPEEAKEFLSKRGIEARLG
jgi:hypothetical protein